MKKVILLLVIFLVALSSLAGYLYLNKLIAHGTVKIAEGQVQIQEGEQMLAQGKARLGEGNRSLNKAKTVYRAVKSVPFMGIVSKLPLTGNAFSIANSKISEGNNLVAAGREKIKKGQGNLAAGKLELERGMNKLKMADRIRSGCAVSTIVFTTLFILLAILWRKRLKTIFSRKR